jgi:hypothetical protein
MAKTTIHLSIDLDILEAIKRNPELNRRISIMVNEFLRNIAFMNKSSLESQKIRVINEIDEIQQKLKMLEGIRLNIENKIDLDHKKRQVIDYDEN